jgi:hypothetical protein
MICKHTRRRHGRSSARIASVPAGRTGRRQSAGETGARRAPRGRTLVEFALVLTVFMVVTVGLIDGLRVIFYYSQVQEAAREGARWGSVQVARAVNGDPAQIPWGTFAFRGNTPGTYCEPTPCASGSGPFYSLTSYRTITATPAVTASIVGAASLASTAEDLKQATITISTTIPQTATEPIQTSNLLTNAPVTVTVQYPFKPILGMVFGGVTIKLKGTSVMLHE